MKVLVYDDETEFAMFLKEAVEDLGHTVAIATNASEFAENFSVETDLIFLDLFMPEVDGIECIRFLSSTGTKASLILMSGQDPAILNSAREGARASNLTVLEVLTKPISLSAVDAALETADEHFRDSNCKNVATTSEGWEFGQSDILAGLSADQFFVVYQPQLRLKDREPVGVEALIRWHHPDHGLIMPNDFIEMAEHFPDTLNQLTRFVMETVCHDLGPLTAISPGLTVSVNLSAVTFDDIGFAEKLLQIVRSAGLETNRLVLEVTETAASSSVGRAIDTLTRLRMAGFGVSIDDFGTGYSSLEQIVQVPFTELKVDKRFVKDMLTSSKCQAICEISCLLGRKTNMLPVAEGVEDEDSARALEALGYVIAQGFYFAKPMRVAELFAWLKERTSNPPVAKLKQAREISIA